MAKTLQENIFTGILEELATYGKTTSPRGLKIIELENFNYVIPPYIRFMNFESRKLNLNYIKREFLWYLKGDKFDLSICEHASMWKDLVNSDGSINSNYGQYIFGKQNQFTRVLNTLIKDKESRRASIIILNKDHLASNTRDYPCTYSINFRIRDNKLNMTIRMRAQDCMFGMCNDLPCFSFVHEMMLCSLREYYPSLIYGSYYHACDSFHVYEKHFKTLNKIVSLTDKFKTIKCPKMFGHQEVMFLKHGDFKKIPEQFEFTKWLNTFD